MAELIRPNTCRTCAHAMRDKDGKNGVVSLFCRRWPPQTHAVPVMTPTGPQLAGVFTVFPRVEPDWWCGEHAVIAVAARPTLDAPEGTA